MVLLQPPQEGLLQRAAGMLRNRDPLAPSNITNEQLQAIRQHPEILKLRREKQELKEEMSQLGMMVIAVGLSSYNIALFHLVNHAFYKALLFLHEFYSR